MKFLNGWKTVVGIAGTLGTVLIASGGNVGEVGAKVGEISLHADAVVTGAFGLLAVLGLVHKAEKRRAAR